MVELGTRLTFEPGDHLSIKVTVGEHPPLVLRHVWRVSLNQVGCIRRIWWSREPTRVLGSGTKKEMRVLIPFRKNSTVCWKTWARKKIYKCRKNARRRTRTPSGNPKHETWSHSHKTFSSGIGGLRQSLTPFGVIGCNESSRKVPSNATSAIQVDFQDTMVAFKGTKLLWRWFLFLSNLHPPELLGCGGGDQQLAINKSKSHLPPLSQIRKSDIYFTSYFTTSLMNLWMQDCDCNDSKSEYNFNAQLVNSRTRFRNQVSETNDLSWQLQVWMLHTSSEKVVAKFADQIFSSNKLLKENFWKAGKFSCSFFLAWDNALSRFWRLAYPL